MKQNISSMSVHFKKAPHPSHRKTSSWFGFVGKFLSYIILTIIGVRMSFTLYGEYDLEGFLSKVNGKATCEDRDMNCHSFIKSGGCNTRPEWMLVNCAKSCKSCHLVDPFVRCNRKTLKISEKPIYGPGEFNRMLSGLKLRLSDKHRVNILSKTPYIITIDNFLSNDEADSILATVNDWQEPQMETPDENSNTDADADVDAEEGLDAEKKIAAERQRKTTSVAAQDEAEEEEETTVAEESKATMKNENTATQKKSTTASTQLLSSSSVKKLPASTKTTTTSTSTSTTLRHQPVSTTGQKKKYQPVHETVTDVEKEDEEEEEEEEDEPSNKYSNKPSNKSSNKQLSNKKQAHRRLQEGAPILRIPKSRHGSHAWCMGECAENDEMENMITRLEETIFVPKTHVEHFQLLKFEKGQGYYAHMDADKSERVLPCGPRILSMIVYMTDVRSGGETAFPLLNITVQPKKGRLLLFQNVDGEDPIFEKIDHKISHGSMPVQAGTKIIMKSFVHPFNFVESMKWDCLNHHINMQ